MHNLLPSHRFYGFLVLLLLPLIGVLPARAQELNCRVSVDIRQLTGTDYGHLRTDFREQVELYFNTQPWTDDTFLDEERIELRAWRAGDRIRLAYGSKKLKRLFQERRIGRGRRAALPVLADSDGAILWVAGVARSSAAPPPAGEPAFEITVMDVDTG